MPKAIDISLRGSYVAGGIKIIPDPIDPDPVIEPSTLTLELPVPTKTVEGDLMVALISTVGNPTLTTPIAWNLEESIGGSAKSFVYWKLAIGNEPASYTWTLDGVEDAVGKIILIRGVDKLSPIQEKETNSGTGSSVTIPEITTTENKTLLLTIISLNDGVLIDENSVTSKKKISLWIVNSSGTAIGSVGSSASYETVSKAGTISSYTFDTVGAVSTDYYVVLIALNPIITKTAFLLDSDGNRLLDSDGNILLSS